MDSRTSGEKAYLRPLTEEDVVLMTKWHNDQEVMRLIGLRKRTTQDFWNDWFSGKKEDRNSVYFGIVKKEDDSLIGYIHLEQIMWDHRLCRDIGIVIGEKEEWDKGYGTEAMRLLISYAFDELRLHRLELMTLDINERGMRVWEKCGFKKEGVLRRARLVEEEWHNVVFMGLLEDEYSVVSSSPHCR